MQLFNAQRIRAALESLGGVFSRAGERTEEARIAQMLPHMKSFINEKVVGNFVPVPYLAEVAFNDLDMSAYGEDGRFISQGLAFFAVQHAYTKLHHPVVPVLIQAHDTVVARFIDKEKAASGTSEFPHGIPHFVRLSSEISAEATVNLTDCIYYAIRAHTPDPDAAINALYDHACAKMEPFVKTLPGPDHGPGGQQAAPA